MRLVQPLWKAVWGFLKKLKMYLPYDPAIPLLGINPKEMKSPRLQQPRLGSELTEEIRPVVMGPENGVQGVKRAGRPVPASADPKRSHHGEAGVLRLCEGADVNTAAITS